MEIREIDKHSIPAVVEVHKSSFKDFFLTQVGDKFLYLYYDCVRKADDAILLGIYDDSELCGFCAASLKSKGFTTRLIKNNLFRFISFGTKLLITKPSALIRLLKNLTKKSSEIVDDGDYAELYSIGVAKNNQGKGIGKQLYHALEDKLQQMGCKQVSLTTDFFENDAVIAFYKSIEFSILYEFVTYPDRKMLRMIKNI